MTALTDDAPIYDPVDGQIDLFTGESPTVIEYGFRHSLPDGDVATVGPFETRTEAQQGGDSNIARHGGTYELVERRTTNWERVTE